MLEESVVEPEEYRNIVFDSYANKINKEMLKDV